LIDDPIKNREEAYSDTARGLFGNGIERWHTRA
jgi:hypothetical protein